MLKMDDRVLPFRFSEVHTLQSTGSTLYILFGQGLGDLIYGNRVLHLLCRKLTGWKIFVFLSKEWEDLSIFNEEYVTLIWYPSIQEYGDRFTDIRHFSKFFQGIFLPWESGRFFLRIRPLRGPRSTAALSAGKS